MTTLSTIANEHTGEEIDQSSFGLEMLPTKPEPAPESKPESAKTPLNLEVECLCPFCGTLNSQIGQPCSNCRLEDTTTTRAATSQRVGPWYVLQPNSLDSAGMNFDHLVSLARSGGVTSRSVVRGATTGQLWRLASKVRGLSREFGTCYSCGGDIEKHETNCPHCDRVQTVLEHADAIPNSRVTPVQPAQELVEDPESPKQVRDALLSEPVIHIRSATEPLDPITAARPVVAECNERHMPKDDLLTPRDLAKAFQLEFGPQPDELDRFLARPNHTMRNLKIAFTSTAALLFAGLLLWPVSHAVSGWIDATPTRANVPSNTQVAFNHPDPYLTAAPSYVPRIAPAVAPPDPVVATAVLTPVTLPEPTPVASAEDDPKLLWNSALDAEASGNYKAAVTAYERIESLPSDSWPTNLETRLTLARKEMKGDVR
jgi:hypothetical protein